MLFEDILINEEANILDAMRQLDTVAIKVLLVHRKNRLLATLTDGDIRRWILRKGSLEAIIKHAANYNPKYLEKKYDEKEALKLMKKELFKVLPVLDEQGCIIDILVKEENEEKEKSKIDLPVVMMAGGKGTRLYPYTKILPKPLIPIGDIPIAEHIINYFHEYGCNNYYLIVNHKKNMIKAYFNELNKPYNVHFVDEDIPLGTGGGLSLLRGKIDSTFLLTNCDILIREDIAKIYKLHKEKKHLITMICSLKKFQIPYGVVEISVSGEIEKIQEKPELSFFTNTGCYIVEPEVIEELEYNKEVGFPDIIEKYKSAGGKIGVYPIGENAWLDMGQMDELERMRHIIEDDSNMK